MKILINYDVQKCGSLYEVVVVFPKECEFFYDYYLGILQSRYELKMIQRRGSSISFRTSDSDFYLSFFTDRPNLFDLRKMTIDKFAYSDGGVECEFWEDAC